MATQGGSKTLQPLTSGDSFSTRKIDENYPAFRATVTAQKNELQCSNSQTEVQHVIGVDASLANTAIPSRGQNAGRLGLHNQIACPYINSPACVPSNPA